MNRTAGSDNDLPDRAPAHPLLTVTHVSPLPPADPAREVAGVPWYLTRILPALRTAGVRRQVVIGQRGGMSISPTAHIAYQPSWRSGPTFLHDVARAVESTRPSVVHLQHEVFLYGGPLTAVQVAPLVGRLRRRGLPVVTTIHGVVDLDVVDHGFVAENGSRMPPELTRRVLRLLIGRTARASDRVIVHDALFRDRLVTQYGTAAERVRVIPIPAPDVPVVARDDARRAAGLTSPTALFFGFVTGYKGLPTLLDAWAVYRGRGGGGELIVAGGKHPRLAGRTDYERNYSALQARAAGIGGVRWTGYLDDDDAGHHLAGADVLVLPYTSSLAASGPMNLAFAHGLPVIVSEALRPLAPDPRCVAPDGVEGLATVLSQVLDGELGSHLAEASRGAGRSATLTDVAIRTSDVYREVAK